MEVHWVDELKQQLKIKIKGKEKEEYNPTLNTLKTIENIKNNSN